MSKMIEIPKIKPSIIITAGYPAFLLALLIFYPTNYARDLLWIIIILLGLFYRRYCLVELKSLVVRPIFISGMVLFSYVMASGFWSTPPVLAGPVRQIQDGLGLFAFWLLSYLYFRQGSFTHRDICLVLVAGILGNLMLAWYFGHELFPCDLRLTGYGTLGNPIFLAAVAVIQLLFALYMPAETTFAKFLRMMLVTAAIIAVVLSGSRGPILAASAVAIIWFIWASQFSLRQKAVIGILAIVLIIVSVIALKNHETPMISRGLSLRPLIWHATLEASKDKWLIGWGWTNDFARSAVNENIINQIDTVIPHPHSLLISSIYYGGVIGLLIHLAFFISVALKARCSPRKGFAFAILTVILLMTLFDFYNIVVSRSSMWIMFWLPVAALMGERQPPFQPALRENERTF